MTDTGRSSLQPECLATELHRLLIVTTGLGLGGAETQIVDMVRRLSVRGWSLKVVSLTTRGVLAPDVEASGVPVITLGLGRNIRSLLSLLRLIRLIRAWQPGVLHAHMFHANVLSRLVRVLAPVPALICTAHSTHEISTKGEPRTERTWRERIYGLTDVLCDLTTHVSQVGLERYVAIEAVPRKKIRRIPNGVDTERFRPDGPTRERMRTELDLGDAFAWLAVGRIERAKDYPTLLAAFSEVLRRRKDGLLLIVGGGSLEAEVNDCVRRFGLGDRVRLLGRRRDVPQIMTAADGFVMSSQWEGFGLALAEAMACGLPVVSTDSGGSRDVLDGGRLGFMVSKGDPEALAREMLRMMSISEEERARIGDNGRRFVVSEFGVERVVDAWESLYHGLILQHGGRSRRYGGRPS